MRLYRTGHRITGAGHDRLETDDFWAPVKGARILGQPHWPDRAGGLVWVTWVVDDG